MDQRTATIIVAGLGIAGTLTSGVVAQWMSRNAQHEQWRRDNISQECRELLGQLSVSMLALRDWFRYLKRVPGLGFYNDQAKAIEERYEQSTLDLHRNLGSRLLIANQMRHLNIVGRWKAAEESFIYNNDEEKLSSDYEGLVEDIVKIGLRH
jgi:hypothetical protein